MAALLIGTFGTVMNEMKKSLDPVFVFAPSARCGITLVQRLLNSTGQIVVHKEDSLLVNSPLGSGSAVAL